MLICDELFRHSESATLLDFCLVCFIEYLNSCMNSIYLACVFGNLFWRVCGPLLFVNAVRWRYEFQVWNAWNIRERSSTELLFGIFKWRQESHFAIKQLLLFQIHLNVVIWGSSFTMGAFFSALPHERVFSSESAATWAAFGSQDSLHIA